MWDLYMDHVVRFDPSENIIYDFKQLNITCLIDDVSYSVSSVLDFMELDVSGQIALDPSFQSPEYDVSFQYDSRATLYVPIDRFQNIFKCNIRKNDILEENTEDLRFAVDPSQWCKEGYVIPFHNSIVDPSFALNPKARLLKQNVQNDYVRSMFFDMTGSLKFSAIFHNTNDLLGNMENLDAPVNQELTTLVNQIGGTTSQPLLMSDTSNNPSRDLMMGMFQLEKGHKDYRKEKMMDALSSQTNQYFDNALLQRFYIQGFSYKGFGYYYPVYVNRSHPDLYIGYKRIRFAEHGNTEFYVNPISLNTNLNDDQYPDYCFDYVSTVKDVFVDVPLVYGDGIQVKLTYVPKTTPYLTRIIHPRAYNMTLIMTLESEYSVDFTDASFQENSLVDGDAVVFGTDGDGDGDGCLDMSGTYSFELLWLGSEDRSDPFFSHVHYYPHFEELRDISLTAFVPSNGGALPDFYFYCRPRYYENAENVKVDIVRLYVPDENKVYDTWHTFTLSDYMVQLNHGVHYTSLNVFNATRINNNTTFTPKIYYRGAQSFLSLLMGDVSGSYMQCSLQDSSIYMKDDHVFHLKME